MIPPYEGKPRWRRVVVVQAYLLVPPLCAAAALCYALFYVSPGRKPPPLPPGVSVVSRADFLNRDFFSSGRTGASVLKKTRDPFLPFSEYLSFTVAGPLPNPYDAQLSLPTLCAVRTGDYLAARFYVRRPFFAAPARTDFVFEQAGGGYRKSMVLPAEAGARWRMVETAFRSAGDYPPGQARVNFRLGFGAQELELAGLELVNYGAAPPAAVAIAAGYAGREPGAAWRGKALARIEKLRKGDIKVQVRDASGRPVAGAKISVKQTRHAFSFGSAVSSKYLYARAPDENNIRYRRHFLGLFNSATIENDMKWPFWYGARKAWADRSAAWLKTNNVALRGHNLVWPGWEHLPPGLGALKEDPEKLRAAIRAHVTEEASYYGGKVRDWDVLNEPLDHSEVLSLLGPSEPAEWFKLARRADPSAKLFVNEYGILTDMGFDTARHAAYEKFIDTLLADGAPLDGIGLQCHFGTDLTPPERLIFILDRFQKLGKPLYATELDIENPDERLQADYLRDFMTAVFSHPAVEGITLWGFWEGVHSAPLPALYRRDWSRKPAAAVLERLLLKEWRTELSGLSGGNGEFQGRGFYGAYEIAASAGNSRGKINAVLSKAGGTFVVVLAAPRRI